MSNEAAKLFLDEAIGTFRGQKALGDKALAQLGDAEFFAKLDDESNSVAVIIKHMAGNMLSRWTDFLTTDGEKSDRNRDMEFVMTAETTRAEMLARWEEGWACTLGALESLQPEDVGKIVLIRGEEHTVVKAVLRQISHYGQHVGQIVLLAKHLRGGEWQTLSIPRNRSAEFNSEMATKIRNTEGT
ncbi:MAG TPA: DUF1572 family protein [Pyrinomonadaceae bacterium]|nr:DUF1572 family protein [Pyrinomonadaceae bacterium]